MASKTKALATLGEMGIANPEKFTRGARLSATARGGALRFLSTNNRVFNFAETDTATKFRGLVIDAARYNAYYESTYSGAATPPDCFAFQDIRADQEEADMKPHPDSGQVHPQCIDCQWNAWGSGPRGNSKACKNYVRLAVLRGPVESANDAKQQVRCLQLPPTALADWTRVADEFAELNAPLFACHLDFEIYDLPSGGFSIAVSRVEDEDGPISDPLIYQTIADRYDEIMEAMLTPPPPKEDQPKPKRAAVTKKKAAARKKVVRKKVPRKR